MNATAGLPATMRGWAAQAYGQEMELMEDLPVPAPGPHDVLIQMRSAEVGDWDELVRTGEWDMQRRKSHFGLRRAREQQAAGRPGPALRYWCPAPGHSPDRSIRRGAPRSTWCLAVTSGGKIVLEIA